jgi:3-hydroxyisobutyrate dehydrogenase
MAKIGFIGLGNMGLPMAGNLVKAGHEVKGFDIVPVNLENGAKRGLTKTASVAEAVKDVDCIVTMLPAGSHVIDVWGGDLLKSARPGTLIIDCSTIDIDSARRAHEMAAAAKMLSLDAPVSGGTVGAEAGTLALMVGGTKEAFDRGKPILEGVGKRIVHCGDPGAGQAAKICNNMMLAVAMLGACEGFNLADKLGLSRQALFDVVSASSGQSWAVTTYCPVPGIVPTSPANNDYKPGFAAGLMLKDLKLAQDAARSTGAATPLGAEAAQLFQLFVSAGNAGQDFSGIIKYLRGAAN